ncbi:cell division protein FtsK [Paenibacillus thiaminolyticus]|uniref:terminase small subunit n=1 Tax=Paenibacillus thiaminolyticus TaxID=49283 RepID=UPI0013F63C15|nr:terminase small subunit [Paenibacillus thiaminolyticus]NGP60071.1 cell division protein FtsK [Paenibacillus thiaminolyticus]
MARARDPSRDTAFEMWKQANGEIKLKDIAEQLGISEGTVRGWKNKDKWDASISEQPDLNAEEDELYDHAVSIVVTAQAVSTSLLQRRLRIGYSRAARLIGRMEKNGVVGEFKANEPREVYLKEAPEVTPRKTDTPNKNTERSNQTERNAPKPNKVTERSNKVEDYEEQPIEVDNEDGSLTDKQRIFVMEYLRDFNATRAAIAAGYSKKTAHVIGWENLRKPNIQAEIKRQKDAMVEELGVGVQRIIAEYMKIAFADISEYVEFGQQDVPMFTEDGEPINDPETGEQMTYKRNFVAFKNSEEVDGTLISEVKQGKDGVSIKLHDKMKALEKLGKYVGFMSEEQLLKLEKARLELTLLRGDSEGDAHAQGAGYAEALNAQAAEVFADEVNEDEEA